MQSLSHDDSRTTDLDASMVESLVRMLDEHNPLVQQFRMARDRLANAEAEDFVI
jgi:hypothetical protein